LSRPCLIGIAGPSCAGKTELSRRLATLLPAPILPLDGYYFDLAHLSPAERAQRNFDTPEVFDQSLFLQHLKALAQGRGISRPVYDFAAHVRTGRVEIVTPAPFLVVEGLLLFHWEEVRKLLSLRVYVDLDEPSCLERRLLRDVKERGRAPESVRRQFAETVRPMAEKYIYPTRSFADLLVRGDAPVEDSVAAVMERVRSLSGSI
jgi:uridine kinase